MKDLVEKTRQDLKEIQELIQSVKVLKTSEPSVLTNDELIRCVELSGIYPQLACQAAKELRRRIEKHTTPPSLTELEDKAMHNKES